MFEHFADQSIPFFPNHHFKSIRLHIHLVIILWKNSPIFQLNDEKIVKTLSWGSNLGASDLEMGMASIDLPKTIFISYQILMPYRSDLLLRKPAEKNMEKNAAITREK